MLAIAAQRGFKEPRLVPIESPLQPQAGEVLCRTLELGVCGTDREILLSAKPWTPPGDDRLILGHECLARIEEVGPGVSEFSPGDLVVPAVRRALPGNKRRADLLPFGAYTERGIVREHGFSQPLWLDRPEYLFRVPPEIADLAVLAEPLAVSEKGVNEALVLTRARLGEAAWATASPPRALVTGMGPIAFTAALACLARGWPVTMLGRDESSTFRATLARNLGAQYERLSITEKTPGDVEKEGFDLLLECTGSEGVMVAGSRWVRSCGVVVWLGSNRVPQTTTCDLQRLVRDGLLRNHIFLGCVNEAPRDFQDALKHLQQLSLDRRPQLTALITARVRQRDSLWHYEHRQPQGIKTVVMYS